MSSSSLVVFTGRNRLRSTASAREPSKTSTAAPMADSIWMTGVLSGRVGSTVLRLTMIGRPRMPSRSARRAASASRSTQRLFAWNHGCRSVSWKKWSSPCGHHGAVAQHQAPVALAHAEVAALAVVAGARADLGDVRGCPRAPSRPAPRPRRSRRGCRRWTGRRSGSRARAGCRAARWSAARRRRHRGPAGTTPGSGSSGHSTGPRSSARSLGSLFCRKSSGSPSTAQAGVRREDLERLLPGAERVHQQQRRSAPRAAGASASTWRAMMSRKLSPSRTGSADFGPLMPMLVPRPPLSLIDDRAPEGLGHRGLVGPHVVEVRHVGERVDGVLGDGARRVRAQLLVVAAEHRHGELGNPRRAHLVRGSAQAVGGHAATLRCGHGP